MRTLSRFGLITAATAIVLAASAVPARADIIVLNGVNNAGTDNVLLNPATNVTTVTGTVGANNLLVNFTSTSGSDLLSANPSGQATVSGGTGNDPLAQLTFGLANSSTFTNAVFNINAFNNGSATIRVDGVNINGGFFQQNFTVDANGQNFFTVTAINGQAITSISLTGVGNTTFEDVRQVRLGGGSINQTTVPEPASMMLLGTGLTAIAAARRRRDKKNSQRS